MNTQKCYTCSETFPLSCFHKDKARKSGHRGQCRTCALKQRKIYYGKVCKEERKAKRNKYRRENPEIAMLDNAKRRAKAKNLPFDLKNSDIKIPTHCPVLGFPLKSHQKLFSFDSPSLDRVDNTKGYTKDNIVIVSWRANSMKGDATLEELKKLTNWLEKELTKNDTNTRETIS